MNYRHLTREQRYQISSLRREGLTLQRIAEHVDCHRSTVSRELRRNLTKGYQPERAHRLAQERRRHASARPRISASTWVEIEARLREECPGGHPKLPQSWPGQNPPAECAGRMDGYTVS